MWHGYIPIEKPAALSDGEWQAVITEIGQRWCANLNSDQPSERPHWSVLADGTVILEAQFASEKITDATGRENAVADAINELYPKYARGTMRSAMRGKVTPLETDKGLDISRSAVVAYIRQKESGKPGSEQGIDRA